MQDIDKLLNPNKTFLEYQDYLIDLIASSYHKQFKDKVATRIKESLYFFDSTPDITYQTIKNNNANLKRLIQYFLLDKNYKMFQLIIENLERDNYYYLLKQFLDIDNNFFKNNKEVILNLDFRVFSKKVNKLLLDKTLDETVKDKIKEKQQEYLDACYSINLKPIIDENMIEQYLFREKIEGEASKDTIIITSLFGRKMMKKIKQTGVSFEMSRVDLANDIVFMNEGSLAHVISRRTKQGKWQMILGQPVLHNHNTSPYYMYSSDETLLHELTHVVESDINGDIHPFFLYNYSFFNEIRTQERSKLLYDKLRQDNIYIFDEPNVSYFNDSYYDKFIPLIESLIREYRGLIDYCAIANKISPLYKNFGRNNFDDLCKHLLDLCNKEQILIDLGIPFKETEDNLNYFKEQVEKIKTYSKRKIIK